MTFLKMGVILSMGGNTLSVLIQLYHLLFEHYPREISEQTDILILILNFSIVLLLKVLYETWKDREYWRERYSKERYYGSTH
jgi:hypothetical protein